MKYIKRFAAWLLAVLLCALPVTAYASDAPDLTKQGSISVEMHYGGKRVSGGELRAYRVAQVVVRDKNYGFETLAPYEAEELSQENLSRPELAESFAGQTEGEGIAPASAENGLVRFENLEPGLYLIVQTQAAPGYSKAAPFLVTVPYYEDGHYAYDVDASVKAELKQELTPDSTPKPTSSPAPKPPSDPKLPQTGQLNWPIPVLTVLGLALFAAGWMLRFGKKRDRYEK